VKTVVCRIDLGFTRVAGYVLYDSDTKEFQELTPKVVMNHVMAHRVNGLTFDKDGEMVPDREGWNLGNIKIRSGVGHYRDFNTKEPKGETVYSVVRAIQLHKDCVIFEVINNRGARVFYTAKQLASLAEFNWVGGVVIDQENNEIKTCKGVQIESIEDQQFIFEVGSQVYLKDNIMPMVDVDKFERDNPVTSESSAQEQAKYEFDQINEEFGTKPETMEDLFKDAPLGSYAPVEEITESAEDVAELVNESAEENAEHADTDESMTDTLKEMYGYEESSADASESTSAVTETPVGNSDEKPHNSHKSKKKHK